MPTASFDCVTIAFGIRNVPRIERALAETYRVLRIGGRFLCLEFPAVDVPGLDALYDLYSFNVIPRVGEAVTGDRDAYQYLVEFDPQISQPKEFAKMMRSRRLAPRFVHADDRRHGGDAFGLAFVIGGDIPSHPSCAAPVLCLRARMCSHWWIRGPMPFPASAAIAHGAADLRGRAPRTAPAGSPPRSPGWGRLTSSSASFSPRGPTWSARRSPATWKACRTRWRRFRKARRKPRSSPPSASRSIEVYASFGPPVAAASIAQVHRAEIDESGTRKAVAVKILRPGIERRFKSDLDAFFFAARKAESFRWKRSGCARSRWWRRSPARWRSKWISAWKPRRSRRWRRTRARMPISAFPRWTGTAPRARC